MQAHVACAPCVPPERCCVSAESPTARFVETASRPKSGRAEYPDAALPGFRLRVTVDGKRSFSLRYRSPADRKHRRLTWPYPAFSLLEAREEAQAALRAIGRDEDSAAANRALQRLRAMGTRAAAVSQAKEATAKAAVLAVNS